jgi:L-amino acid N-acyltransferase YncA
MEIREAFEQDFDRIWPIFSEIVAAGETYTYARTTTRAEALDLWLKKPRKTYIATEGGQVLGTYYLASNQPGAGRHVCNCGYMVASSARGRGVASRLCEHSQDMAMELGYQAMQFNFVVSTNTGAVKLWKKLGFEIVGTLPKAFKHPKAGYVDAFIMYKWLE